MDHHELNDGIAAHLRGRGELSEGPVLDGDGYFLDGLLVVTVMGDDICLQVGANDWQTTLARDGVRPLLFADRPVPGWVIVDGASLSGGDALAAWIEGSLARN